MNEELKPCPFCGGEAREVIRLGGSLVYCLNCERSTGLCKGDKAARELWNIRPIEDEKDKVIARLKGNWDYLKEYLVTLRNSKLHNVCFDDSELNRYAITFLNELIEKIYDTDNNVGSTEEGK